MPRYVFEVRVAGAIRVRAADEAEARKVVPAVLLLPGPDEVRMANDNNARIGWDGTITSVNFRVMGGLTLVSMDGKRVKSARCERTEQGLKHQIEHQINLNAIGEQRRQFAEDKLKQSTIELPSTLY